MESPRRTTCIAAGGWRREAHAVSAVSPKIVRQAGNGDARNGASSREQTAFRRAAIREREWRVSRAAAPARMQLVASLARSREGRVVKVRSRELTARDPWCEHLEHGLRRQLVAAAHALLREQADQVLHEHGLGWQAPASTLAVGVADVPPRGDEPEESIAGAKLGL